MRRGAHVWFFIPLWWLMLTSAIATLVVWYVAFVPLGLVESIFPACGTFLAIFVLLTLGSWFIGRAEEDFHDP
jgi:hypothetical protein